MPPITSPHNQKLKEIRKLRMRRRDRERAGRFVAEGEDLLAAADTAGWEPVERFCVEGSGLAGVEVAEKLLASASGLASGTRTLAVYEERWVDAPLGPLCVYLHGVHDPGNVGAVLRSADAFGASCVAIGPGTADPFSPKAVRASMGALFGVPLAKVEDLGELPGTKIALVAGAGSEVWQIASARRKQIANPHEGGREEIGREQDGREEAGREQGDVTLLIGSEREGLPKAIQDQADQLAHIPIQTDSLNAAMAATVALYELTRMAPQ